MFKKERTLFIRCLLCLSLITTLLVPITASLAVNEEVPQKSFFTLTIVCSPEFGETDIAEVWKPELKKIGIDLNIVTVEDVDTLVMENPTKSYEEGGWDIVIKGASPELGHPGAVIPYSILDRPFVPFVKDEDFWTMVDELAAASDETTLKKVSGEALSWWIDNLPIFDFLTDKRAVIFNPNVKNTDKYGLYFDYTLPMETVIKAGMYYEGKDTYTYAETEVWYLLPFFGWYTCGPGQFQRLLWMKPEDKTLVPELAESWEISPDGTVYTFHLKKDVVWSDEEPFTSADCKFTFDLMLNPTIGSEAGIFLRRVIDSMETPDELTFVIHTKKAVPFFLEWLARSCCPCIVPKHTLENIKPEDMANSDYATGAKACPTTGWYVLDQMVVGDYIRFKRNPLLHSSFTPVKNEYFILKKVGEKTTIVSMIKTGEVSGHYAGLGMSADAPALKGDPKVIVVDFSPNNWLKTLHLNPNHPILCNKYVRRALAYSFPANDVAKKVFSGYGEPAGGAPLSPSSEYWPTGLQTYTYDISKAKQMMEKAGYHYDLLKVEIPPTPYLEYGGFLIGGIIVGTLVGFAVARQRARKTP